MMRLGVNIDHVATLRNARGGMHPSPVKAAKMVESCGADLLVVHLREDRRHIKDEDVTHILKEVKIPLQLEIAPTKFMFDFTVKNNIKKVCIVPEKRKELTTEGGLDLISNRKFLEKNLSTLLENEVEVSLFIDPEKENIELVKNLGINKIELHTGEFANSSKLNEEKIFKKIKEVSALAVSKNINVSAGHGLNFDKVKKLIQIKVIEELNIGHFIIGEAIFYGLETVIKKMLNIIKNNGAI